MCAHVCIVYVCIWSCPCICTCVTVHLCCVLVWELLSDCHGLLTQTLMQQCSLVADLRCIVCVSVCVCVFSPFLSCPGIALSKTEQVAVLFEERKIGLVVLLDFFFLCRQCELYARI